MKIFIVIPAYNEEKRIGKVLDELRNTKHKTLVVDDGSTDGTYKIASNGCDYVLRHRVNLGKGASMKTGAEAAFLLDAEAVIFMDSDGQHMVSDLNKFTDSLNSGRKLVFGARQWGGGVPFVRMVGNKLVSGFIFLLFGVKVSDILCGYRAIARDIYEKIKWNSLGYGVETEMIIRAIRARVTHCEVPVAAVYLESYKGMTFGHSLEIMTNILRWRLRI